VGHGTFSRGSDILDAYKHAEYFEAAARMAWEANQQRVDAQAYTEEIVSCILREFNANREASSKSDDGFPDSETSVQSDNVYNYP
jgi:ribulose-5-phosphate 4-epimerase/fuculose-1-phosphate aldolase